MDDLGPCDDQRGVAEGPAEAEERDVAGLGLLDLMRLIEHGAQVALLAPVQMPVARIGPRVERLDQAEIDEHAHQQHRAIAADALDVGADMIRRADPFACGGDDRRAGCGFVHGGLEEVWGMDAALLRPRSYEPRRPLVQDGGLCVRQQI